MNSNKNYQIDDIVPFNRCGTDCSGTRRGKVIYASENHAIVQIECREPFAADDFCRIGLPYEIVRGIIGSDIPHNKYDQFVDMYDAISLEYHNSVIEEECAFDDGYDIIFTKEGNYYYYRVADSADYEVEEESANWVPINSYSIDDDLNNLICVEIDGRAPGFLIHTWGEVIKRFGKQIAYALKRDGSYVIIEDSNEDNDEAVCTLIQVFKPIRK